jgi:hypothetical protein
MLTIQTVTVLYRHRESTIQTVTVLYRHNHSIVKTVTILYRHYESTIQSQYYTVTVLYSHSIVKHCNNTIQTMRQYYTDTITVLYRNNNNIIQTIPVLYRHCESTIQSH